MYNGSGTMPGKCGQEEKIFCRFTGGMFFNYEARP